METVRVSLHDEEYGHLLRLCRIDLRGPSDELRHLVREESRKRGLWPPEEGEEPRTQAVRNAH